MSDAIVLHGGPDAGSSHVVDDDSLADGQVFVPAPLPSNRYRSALYRRRTLVSGGRKWTEWHFAGYLRKAPSKGSRTKQRQGGDA